MKNFMLSRICVIMITLMLIFLIGCEEEEESEVLRSIDGTIPTSSSWHVNTILDLSDAPVVSPRVKFFHDNGRLHMAYYDQNPNYDEVTNDINKYRVRYRAFNVGDAYHLNDSNTMDETVTFLDTSGRSLLGLSVAVAGGTPIVAYSIHKAFDTGTSDFNNQGDIMLGVRDGAANWRNEIMAFGYCDPIRNPVFTDALAKDDFSLKGDDQGNAQLSFQFYYEGIDSYNYAYPDLRYIIQPINNIADDVLGVADLEETVEGNIYYANGTGLQYYQGGDSDLLIDNDGNQVVFYYNDLTENSSPNDIGLSVARRIDGVWQQREWLDRGIEVVDISGVVKSNGLLAVAYTIKDGSHLFMDETDLFSTQTLPFSIRYAEQIEIITEVENDEGEIEEVITYEWETETVNFNTIGGRYCSLAVDSSDNPVVAYFDEMNFTLNRFFSRIKVSHRNSGGIWDVEVITPEHVGLTNKTSPFDVAPGTHDTYYIGKYNYLWVDRNNRVNICSYSNISRKVYLFTER